MLDKIKNIFYRPDFFRRQEFTTGQALNFYSLSVLFLVLGFSFFLIPAAWKVNRFFESAAWQEQKAIVQNLYPDDLVLRLENGTVMTNQAEPVVIPFPAEWRSRNHREPDSFPANLLVIDREGEVSRKAMEARDTLVLINETEMGVADPQKGKTEIIALATFTLDKPIEITDSAFDYWVIERGASLVKTATLFLMSVLPLVMYIGLWMGYLAYSLLGAWVVWLAAHMRGHSLRYAQAYRSTLYLLPAPFMASLLLSAGGAPIPLLFTAVLFAMALINFSHSSSGTVGNSVPPTPPRPAES